MRYDWIDDYLMGKRSVTRDLQPEWNWIRYKLGDKMFAAVLLDDEDDPVYINLKLDPEEGAFFRQQYEDIIPGYYSDKRCWNSVKADGAVPDALLKGLLDKSRQLVLRAFSKKRQREILNLSVCGTDCDACALHGSTCAGCNACEGMVCHATSGKPCTIYACAAKKHRLASCLDCKEVPCALWRNTRDPSMTDEAFEESIRQRLETLKASF